MDGIAVRHSLMSNALLVYNPRNKNFYGPEKYHLNPYFIPSSIYPNIKYDGGLFCSLLCDEKASQDEWHPPGTWVVLEDPATCSLQSGIIWTAILIIPNSNRFSSNLTNSPPSLSPLLTCQYLPQNLQFPCLQPPRTIASSRNFFSWRRRLLTSTKDDNTKAMLVSVTVFIIIL